MFLSALGPGVVWFSNNEYNVFTLPPLLCLPATTSLIFYTICLPLVILLTIGINLIAVVLWTLLQVNNIMILCMNKLQCNSDEAHTDGMPLVVTCSVSLCILLKNMDHTC